MTSARASRHEVYCAIESERNYQQRKANSVGKEEQAKPLESYVVYMDDYLRELKTQISRTWTPDGTVPAALDTLRKITALGVAAMEHNGAPLRHHLDGVSVEECFARGENPVGPAR